MSNRSKFGFQLLLAAALLSPLGFIGARGQDSKNAETRVYGPGICLDARFWENEGWRSRAGDYAYVRITSGRTTPTEIHKALKNIPEASRMLRSSTIEGLDNLLHELVELQGFKLGSLGYESGSLTIEDCRRVQALAHRFGLSFFAFTTLKQAEQWGGQLAHSVDRLGIDVAGASGPNAAAISAGQRTLYEKLLAANPAVIIFQQVNAAEEGKTSQLRYYKSNSDVLRGILLSANSKEQAGGLLRSIRPDLDGAYAISQNEGPSLYFFTFHWKTPGWQPRKGDYAVAKIRPALKTFEEKVSYVLEDLKPIAPENRMLQVNTLSGAAELLKEVIEAKGFRLACLGYDLEDWDLTAGDEKQDPIAACKYGQSLANRYGLDFIVTPDMSMSRKWGARVAPFISAIKPQCKGLEAQDIEKAIEYQRNLSVDIRRANPDIRVLHDVGIAPKNVLQTPEGLLRYYAGVADVMDGIGIFSLNTPEQNAVIGRYIVGVRPPAPAR